MFKRFGSKQVREEEEQPPEPPPPPPAKPALKSALKDSVGTFAYNKMPEHERTRFEAALSVQKRTAMHAGNAFEYEEYNTHVASQLEAKENEEERRYSEVEAAQKKKLMSQASVMRRVNGACADETSWKRNQARQSMRVSLKLPELGQSMAIRNGKQQVRHDLIGDDDEDDWLSQHTGQGAPGPQARQGNGPAAAKGSMRWMGANANQSQRGSIRMMPPQQGGDPGSWLAKTRNFMQGVVGKITGDELSPTGQPMASAFGGRRNGSILSRLSGGPSLSAPDTPEAPDGGKVTLNRSVSRSAGSAMAMSCPDPRQMPGSATPEPWLVTSKSAADAEVLRPRASTSLGSATGQTGWRQFLPRSRASSVCEPSAPMPGMSALSEGGLKLPSISLKSAVSTAY